MVSGDAELERVARIVVDAGILVHRELGPGLLESVYEFALAYELRERGIEVACQVAVPLNYKGVVFDNAFRADLVVEQRLLIELKSTAALAPVHGKQLLTYLRLMELPLGLLMNFGQETLKAGLKRVANNYYGSIGQA